MFSFVIPAHNEEALLGATLRALQSAAQTVAIPFELIVVDDASTDRTAEIARSCNATVLSVNLRKISAVRNAGARVAQGEVLVFVDADTLVPAATLAAVVKRLRQGVVGGGAFVKLDDGVPLWGRLLTRFVTAIFFELQLAGGCFLFARREAFDAVGGFDEDYFASEEVHLSRALHRQGRFVLVRQAVTTSGRKFRLYSAREFFAQALHFFARGGWSGVKHRDALPMWYEAPREPAAAAGSLTSPSRLSTIREESGRHNVVSRTPGHGGHQSVANDGQR
jgi:glycosyltransferase involved in cell wall biosynthesis